MSGIYGIVRFDGAPVDPEDLATMRAAMAEWGREGGGEWHAGVAGVGQLLFIDTPEAANEVLPRVMPSGAVLTAAGRIDNREDLFRELGVPHELRPGMPDSVLIERAFLHWGEDCAVRLLGDWSFAVWDPATRRFFLARDHHGNTALYYTVNERFLAFASGRRALLALDIGPVALDDLYIAQVLLAWPVYHGERTVHVPIKRLPPSHALAVTGEGAVQTHRYWYMEDVTELRLKSFDDYVEGFLEVWDEAVRARVRSSGPVGVMMSGGLDSTSVAATAAMFLRERGERLQAYTSVPIYDTAPYVPKGCIGDEWPLAKATADYVGSIDLHAVTAEDITPLEGVREALRIHNEPIHAASNAYWVVALQRMAQAHGVRVLLTGQGGNLGASWPGLAGVNPTLTEMAKAAVRSLVPSPWLRAWYRWRTARRDQLAWLALSPELIRATEARSRYAETPDRPHRSSLHDRAMTQRMSALRPGRSAIGLYWSEKGTAHGMAVRDATFDLRVLSFSLGVPDRHFTDAGSGQRRWLMRRAMAGRLPDGVRLCGRRGFQHADLVPRLRTDRTDMELVLEVLKESLAEHYLDLGVLRCMWRQILTGGDAVDPVLCSVTLLRGVLGGLLAVSSV